MLLQLEVAARTLARGMELGAMVAQMPSSVFSDVIVAVQKKQQADFAQHARDLRELFVRQRELEVARDSADSNAKVLSVELAHARARFQQISAKKRATLPLLQSSTKLLVMLKRAAEEEEEDEDEVKIVGEKKGGGQEGGQEKRARMV